MRLGYARVSRADQHTEQQEIALRDAGCEKILVDRGVSGALKSRPELDRLLDQLRPEDVVVITKIDRLSRDLHQMLDLVATIHAQGADIVSLAEQEIDTTSAAGKLVFAIFAVVAQFERDRLRERTKEGLARAKANGSRLGRPRALSDSDYSKLRKRRTQGWSYSELADVFKISRTTARKYCSDLDVPAGVRIR